MSTAWKKSSSTYWTVKKIIVNFFFKISCISNFFKITAFNSFCSHKKSKSWNLWKFGHRLPHLRPFLFFSILSLVSIFELFQIFFKWIEGFIIFHLKSHLLRQNIYVGKKLEPWTNAGYDSNKIGRDIQNMSEE